MDKTDEARATLEARMGEIAAFLDDVAEALVYYPEEITITDDGGVLLSRRRSDGATARVDGWPTIQEIDQLLSTWRSLKISTSQGVPPRTRGRPRAT